MPDFSIYMAFAAGLISFLSPCVLPLVPGYISFLSGVSRNKRKKRRSDLYAHKERHHAVEFNILCRRVFLCF
ncbi:MAG: hypothetical protein JSV31_10210 [Desulfobacterales bacterium]|nr:MAG: hypothetical protein JSV31_10210 [Desulfobacterales bacterium]